MRATNVLASMLIVPFPFGYALATLLAGWRGRMSDTIGAVPRSVALLLSPVLCLQACNVGNRAPQEEA